MHCAFCLLKSVQRCGKDKCFLIFPLCHSMAGSCPGCLGLFQMSWCQNLSHHHCPQESIFLAIASVWHWDVPTDPGSQNGLSSLRKDPGKRKDIIICKYLRTLKTKWRCLYQENISFWFSKYSLTPTNQLLNEMITVFYDIACHTLPSTN